MKKESMSDNIIGRSLGEGGGYVNHGLCSSGLDLTNHHNHAKIPGSGSISSPGAPSYQSGSYVKSYDEVQGSSDFVLINECESSNDEPGPSCFAGCTDKCCSLFSRKTLFKRLPILRWIKNYNTEDFVGDLVAGVTVGLTVIPQSLAYSNIAGLPAEYGLYGSFLGCFIYMLFGSCKDVPMGPTAIVSLLTFQSIGHLPEAIRVPHAILLTLVAGIVELLLGLFGLGFLLDFVSGPVGSGFTSACALIIVSSQVKDILGVPAKGATFLEIWGSIINVIHETSWNDCAFGLGCIVLLLFLKSVATWSIGPEDERDQNCFQRMVNKTLWLIGTSRNALLVIIGGFVVYAYKPPFRIIGHLPSGLPAVVPPQFNYNQNGTTGTFMDMWGNLGSGVIVLPLISIMETISISKAFSNGKAIDASQEMIAIGISNICNAFVQAFPGGGSLSRSAVNNTSGVRTPFGGVYTGALVIIALVFFTPYFAYIPKATLAAIIIAAVIFMVEVKVVRPMWRAKKSDLILGIITFVGCLMLKLEVGFAIGIGINILFILYHAARPKISIENLRTRRGVEYLMLTPDRCLIFPSVDYVRNVVTKYSQRHASGSMPVVIDCSHIYGADYTAAKVVESLTRDFAARSQPLFFYNLKPSVYAVFDGVSPMDFVVYYNEDSLDDLLRQRTKKLKQDFDNRVP